MKTERENAENPYIFSPEELTYPGSESGTDWLDNIISKQKEGIEQGVRPQMPRGLPKKSQAHWRHLVWQDWLKRLPPKDWLYEKSFVSRTSSKINPDE